MLVVLRFQVSEEPEFVGPARAALQVLAAQPGYRGGELCRAYDEPTAWCLATRWDSVGAYRRALGSYEVKLTAAALLGQALPEASAFEPLAAAGPGEPVQTRGSDRMEPGDGSIPSPP